MTFTKGGKDTSQLFEKGTHIDDITPLDVFNKMLEDNETPDNELTNLQEAFRQLLEETLESEEL